ncbi:hypothetical protein DH09_02015 [Bacillaceae bacterium JMAK1]|nr:hypothetical protein DH09_02015 [Bacillaceae bacterium JMAK1]
MANFVHLQVKSEYSFLTSTCRIDALVARAKSLGYETLALTDRNVMYGVKKFIDACHNGGIKPIIGLELDVVSNQVEGNVLVYAKNAQGYQTLLSFSTFAASSDGRIDVQQLAQFQTDDVIFIFPEQTHPIAKLISLEQHERATEELQRWRHVLPNHNYWCGLLPSTHTDLHEHNAWVTFLAEQNLTPVALANVTMLNQGDDWIKQCLHAIRDDVPVTEVNRFEWRAESHLLSEEEATATWQNEFERRALYETVNVADLLHVSLEPLTTTLPSVSDEEETTQLQQLVRKGASVRFPELTNAVKERLAKEMQTIKKMGFSNYFLIVWDYMRFARKQEMLTGPARGSAAGSLVAYCLFITDVNPLEYGLLFERFLNPERKSLPDIDLDFPDDRRDEMFHYLAKRYGSEHVAQIITFGTFGVRSSLRETAKVQGIRDALLQRVLKFVPSAAGELKTVIKDTSELQRLFKENEEVREWFNRALAIEGLPRHTSLHAAGIVLSKRPLTSVVPIVREKGALAYTQLPMEDLDAFGLLKFDLLGLRNLTLLDRLQKDTFSKTGQHIEFNRLPTDDQRTMQMLASGQTAGVFQFESVGMQSVLRKLKPSQFEDIVAVNALYRPGPMDNIDTFIRGKKAPEKITYLHDSLRQTLSLTYGVMVYQEQVMQVAVQVANYSLADADLLRRVISKKNKDVLIQEEERFLAGAMGNGYDQSVAKQLFEWILQFANYGFNRSHAVAYSLIAYRIAYFKAHFPGIFYAAYFSMISGDLERMKRAAAEMKRKELTLLGPSVNNSDYTYVADERGVRFPLQSVAHVGGNIAKAIVAERKEKGRFRNFIDFCRRMKPVRLQRNQMISLIRAGALDEWEQHRAVLLASIDRAKEYIDFEDDVGALFKSRDEDFRYAEREPYTHHEMLLQEKEATGFYLSGHPLDEYLHLFHTQKPIDIGEVAGQHHDQHVWIAGTLETMKPIRTKNGQSMAFLNLSDDTGRIEIVVFPDVYREMKDELIEGELLVVFGKVESNANRIKVLAQLTQLADHAKVESTTSLYLKIPQHLNSTKTLRAIKRQLRNHSGFAGVKVYHESERKLYELDASYHVHIKKELLERLTLIVGEENVVKK